MPDIQEIRSVAFARSTLRTGRTVAARVHCDARDPTGLRCEAVTPGFIVELMPERARHDDHLLVGLRIHRRLGIVRQLCLVKFSIGEATATASITVLP
jgi:hypothetical protein